MFAAVQINLEYDTHLEMIKKSNIHKFEIIVKFKFTGSNYHLHSSIDSIQY